MWLPGDGNRDPGNRELSGHSDQDNLSARTQARPACADEKGGKETETVSGDHAWSSFA